MTSLPFKIIYGLLMIATLSFLGKSHAVTALAGTNTNNKETTMLEAYASHRVLPDGKIKVLK